MNDSTHQTTSTKAASISRKPPTPSPPPPGPNQPASPQANRRAAAILEVLAGLRTAAEAAAALGISVNHYYLLERKALAGLLSACEPQPKGPRGPGAEQKLAALQRELEECRRECLRQTALVRATQRAVGLPASATARSSRSAAAKGGKKKGHSRKRRPAVRALRAANELRQNCSGDHGTGALQTAAVVEGATDPPVKDDQQGAER